VRLRAAGAASVGHIGDAQVPGLSLPNGGTLSMYRTAGPSTPSVLSHRGSRSVAGWLLGMTGDRGMGGQVAYVAGSAAVSSQVCEEQSLASSLRCLKSRVPDPAAIQSRIVHSQGPPPAAAPEDGVAAGAALPPSKKDKAKKKAKASGGFVLGEATSVLRAYLESAVAGASDDVMQRCGSGARFV
jgi:hypothetical protein